MSDSAKECRARLLKALDEHIALSEEDRKAKNDRFCDEVLKGNQMTDKEEHPGQISDGYHTFDELYEHRCLLFLALCREGDYDDCCWVAEHYPGWDCVFYWSTGGQISYHVPVKYRAAYSHFRQETESPWDGHTSTDVVERLKRAVGL